MDDEEAGWTAHSESSLLPGQNSNGPSIYALSRSEATKSLANRLIHSRAYILFYLAMAALSVTTVVLSLVKGCPGVAFFILEIIVNSAMIAEVVIRMIALSKAFWKSIFNWLDMVVTLFCVVTLIVVVSTPCASKNEEIFDTLILVARNLVQFGRLFSIMRKSGTSIFARPKAIDLSRPRPSAADIDMSDDELYDDSAYTRLGTGAGSPDIIFDARREAQAPARTPAVRPVVAPPPEEDEDMWANVS